MSVPAKGAIKSSTKSKPGLSQEKIMKALNDQISVETEQIDPQEVKQELLKNIRLKWPANVQNKSSLTRSATDRKCLR